MSSRGIDFSAVSPSLLTALSIVDTAEAVYIAVAGRLALLIESPGLGHSFGCNSRLEIYSKSNFIANQYQLAFFRTVWPSPAVPKEIHLSQAHVCRLCVCLKKAVPQNCFICVHICKCVIAKQSVSATRRYNDSGVNIAAAKCCHFVQFAKPAQ